MFGRRVKLAVLVAALLVLAIEGVLLISYYKLQRFFQDYEILEGKEMNMGGFSDPEEAKGAIRHAMELYDEHFASWVHTTKGAEQ